MANQLGIRQVLSSAQAMLNLPPLDLLKLVMIIVAGGQGLVGLIFMTWSPLTTLEIENWTFQVFI